MISTTYVTRGTSPKAIFAAVAPALGGFVAIAVQWIATGALDRNELATAVGAVLASALAFAGAYAAEPGEVVPANPAAGRAGERGYSVLEVLAVLLVAMLLVIVFIALLDHLH